MVLKEKLRQFILENFMFGAPADQLNDDASFLEEGIIDSTGVMELILFMEEEFGVKVEDTELVPENLDSVNRVCAFLTRKGVSSGADSGDGETA